MARPPGLRLCDCSVLLVSAAIERYCFIPLMAYDPFFQFYYAFQTHFQPYPNLAFNNRTNLVRWNLN